jgi:polysaccharide biosynthesis transport protein
VTVATPLEYRTPDDERDGVSLRDYLGVIWRRKWVVVLVTVVAALAAFGVSSLQSKVYLAQADLIYERSLDVANPLTGQTYTDSTTRLVDMQSVDAIINSPPMQQRANTILQQRGLPATGYEMTAEIVVPDTTATNQLNNNVVAIKATSKNPALAAAAAQAYADSFVSWRLERVRSQISRAVAAVKTQVADYTGAAKQSSDYLILQQRLRDLQILKATATGNFRVLVPASVPTSPVEPKPLRSALLGLGIGLFAGIGLAFLLEQFDTRLRRAEDVAALLRQPILGRVPRLTRDQAKTGELVAMAHPADAVSEAFRLVRTNLAFMDVDDKVKSLMITSSLQGEGKSVAIANLAVTMALAGKKVVVVDADLRRPRQHRLFGLKNEVGGSSVAARDVDLISALQPVDVAERNGDGGANADFGIWAAAAGHQARLWVLTSGPIPPNPGEIVASKRFSDLLAKLREQADIVLVDSPAMLAVGDTAALASEVDGLVYLIDMDKARRPVLQAAADQLYRLPCAMMGLIVRLPAGGHERDYYYSHYRYSQDSPAPQSKKPAPIT